MQYFCLLILIVILPISGFASTGDHVFLIDNSGSMKGDNGIVSKAEYKDFLESMFNSIIKHNDSYQIILFDTDAKEISKGRGGELNIRQLVEEIVTDPDRNDTNLQNALTTGIRKIEMVNDGMIWLLTDNMADIEGHGPSDTDIRQFYDMLNDTPNLRIIYSYPRVFSGGKGFMMYGIYYSPEPINIETDRVIYENVLGTLDLKNIFQNILPIKIKPKGMNTILFDPKPETLELEKGYKSEYDKPSKKFIVTGFKEDDKQYNFKGKVIIKSNFNHHKIENANIDVTIDKLDMPAGIELTKDAISSINPKVITRLEPLGESMAEITFSIPKPEHHFRLDTFLRDITSNTWPIKSALNIKISDVDISLKTEGLPNEIFGVEHIPSIFKPEYDQPMDNITIPVEFHIRNSAKFLIAFIILLLLLAMIAFIAYKAMTRRANYTYWIGGEEKIASIAMFRSVPVIGKHDNKDIPLGYIKRGISGIRFEPGMNVDAEEAEDGKTRLSTKDAKFVMDISQGKTQRPQQLDSEKKDKPKPSGYGDWV